MLGVLLSVSGTWWLSNLVCFALSSGADWIDHTPRTRWIGPSEAFSCFIPFYSSLPLQETTSVCFSVYLFVHMYACRMSLVVLWTYIFNLHKWYCVLHLILFLSFSSGLNLYAAFLLLWCASNSSHWQLHTIPCWASLTFYLHIFLMSDPRVAPTPFVTSDAVVHILKCDPLWRWFSTGDDFASPGIFSNFWRHT